MEIKASGSLLFLSLLKILQWGIRFYNYFFACVHFFLRNLLKFCFNIRKLWRKRTRTWIGNINEAVETYPLAKPSDEEICMEEMKIVMARLGIACEEGDDDGVEDWKLGVSEFSEILLDEEPSWAEIKQVFEVFDENKDGFIDATELQRVLRGLCLKEGSKLEDCTRMICAFDDNGDGLLDFEEFVAFMDKCF